MQSEKATMAVLIIDVDPTLDMETAAAKVGSFAYKELKDSRPQQIEKVQIITSSEVIDGARISRPYSMQEIKNYRSETLL